MIGSTRRGRTSGSSSSRRGRRRALTAAVLAAGAAVTVTVPTAAASPADGEPDAGPRPTVVLVHGARADSGVWDGVVAALQRDGYSVDVFPTPLQSLSGDSAALRAFLITVDGPVVLVGHSYGGAVVSDAATGLATIRALVYLDAFAHNTGEAVASLAGSNSVLANPDPSQVFRAVPAGNSSATELYILPGLFPSAFANDLPAIEARLLAATQRPVTAELLDQPSSAPAWKTLPSWYEVGTLDEVIPLDRQLQMAQRAGAHIVRARTSHLPMMSRPGTVTRTIETRPTRPADCSPAASGTGCPTRRARCTEEGWETGATMMALRAHRRGGPETLVYERAPRPSAGNGEVLVAVHAAAITFAELTWDATWENGSGVDRTPTIPSHEFSGVVAEVGTGVAELRPGQEVFGLVPFDRDGAAAEFVAVPADFLARRPPAVPDSAAAAVSLAGLTAWQAVIDRAAVVAGEDVLILGGTGGVGSLAVQLAAQRGARVTTTHRHGDPSFLRTLGADRTIDVAAEALDASRRYDVVIDTAGTGPAGPALDALRDGGRLVLLSAPLPVEVECKLRARGVRSTFFIVSPDPAALGELADRVASGRLHVPIAAGFPLAEGRAAFQSGTLPTRRPGKVVLTVHR